jgi:spore coat protein A
MKGVDMFTRRQFLKYSAVASLVGVGSTVLPWEAIEALAASPVLTRYVDALPIPGAYDPVGTYLGLPFYKVDMTQFTQKLHRDLPATTLWGYNGTYPGGSFDVRKGEPILVRWVNSLPTTHLLPIDYTLNSMMGMPDVRAVVHLHGGNVPSESDGGPMNWFTPGGSAIYEYPNIQQAATCWYHDHAMAITRLNTFAGLAGFWIFRDDVEDALNLPSGDYEVPIVIQDRAFKGDGSLDYPSVGITHPVWVPEFFGDTVVVNGKVWPFLEVEPRKYRLRFLNGSPARFYHMTLSSGQPFKQIGSELGLFAAPVILSDILIAPAERADVIVDFSGHAGENIVLLNDAPAPYPMGGDIDIPEIMQFRVSKPLSGPDTSALPASLRPLYRIPEGSAHNTRDVVLQEFVSPADEPIILKMNGMLFSDPVTETPRLGTTEIWNIINTTGDTHPIHLHLVEFQVLDRQPFDIVRYMDTGQLVFTGPAVPPDANEMGWKDTVRVNSNEVGRIIARFGSFAGAYVYHCHILEHEDNEMMRPYQVESSVYYFAEGTCRPDYESYIVLQNPGSDYSNVRITYMLGDGTTRPQDLVVDGKTRATVRVKDFLGEGDDEAHDFSAKVESTNGVQVIAERAMYFNYQGAWAGGHCVMGALAPAGAWYFAEGTCRPNFDSYLCIQNPAPDYAEVKITYALGDGTSKVQTMIVPANSRATVTVADFLGKGDDEAHDFSAKVESINGSMIVAERSVYFNYNEAWTGGHCVMGALTPALDWYFAEGTCRPNNDPFFCIFNPGETDTDVRITYLLGDGTTQTQKLAVDKNSRLTVPVKGFLGEADDAAHDFSATVSSTDGVEIVVERAMYFNYNGEWAGGHCVMGAYYPSSTFYFAEGTCRPGFDPYICIQNPDPLVGAKVDITYMLGGGGTQLQSLTVPAASRSTVRVKDFLGEGDDEAHDFSAKVDATNGPLILVERPMYFNYQGAWTGGHCVVGMAY